MGEAKRRAKSGGSTPSAPKTADEGLALDEALELAVKLQRSGKVALADTLYGRILAAAPDYVDALHFYGILKHQQGKSLDAIRMIRRAIDLDEDDNPSMHNNLGNILMEIDRHDLARKAYEMAIVIEPGSVEARNNLGVALRVLKEYDLAETVYREAIGIQPNRREPWDNLGRLLSSRGRVEEAIAAHAKALELEPGNADSRRYLVAAYASTNENDRALEILKVWLKDEPNNPSARHLVAAISGENVPERAEDSYVEALFDGFAASFDHKLAKLAYQAPGLVGLAVENALGEPRQALSILDAGCGTGLCGIRLKPFARHLVGVDLSANMLQRARARNEYDSLERGELTAFLLEQPGIYDVIVSADTLCYFGSLDAVAAAAAGALKPGGLLVFTVEEEVGGPEFKLNTHGRYSHSTAHVSAALAKAGLSEDKCERAPLRMERGEAVAGFVVTARKS